jgi:hypothetical protein
VVGCTECSIVRRSAGRMPAGTCRRSNVVTGAAEVDLPHGPAGEREPGADDRG